MFWSPCGHWYSSGPLHLPEESHRDLQAAPLDFLTQLFRGGLQSFEAPPPLPRGPSAAGWGTTLGSAAASAYIPFSAGCASPMKVLGDGAVICLHLDRVIHSVVGRGIEIHKHLWNVINAVFTEAQPEMKSAQ